jgi:hypothetical protein
MWGDFKRVEPSIRPGCSIYLVVVKKQEDRRQRGCSLKNLQPKTKEKADFL